MTYFHVSNLYLWRVYVYLTWTKDVSVCTYPSISRCRRPRVVGALCPRQELLPCQPTLLLLLLLLLLKPTGTLLPHSKRPQAEWDRLPPCLESLEQERRAWAVSVSMSVPSVGSSFLMRTRSSCTSQSVWRETEDVLTGGTASWACVKGALGGVMPWINCGSVKLLFEGENYHFTYSRRISMLER